MCARRFSLTPMNSWVAVTDTSIKFLERNRESLVCVHRRVSSEGFGNAFVFVVENRRKRFEEARR